MKKEEKLALIVEAFRKLGGKGHISDASKAIGGEHADVYVKALIARGIMRKDGHDDYRLEENPPSGQ